jgi:hypothetical protein
MLIYTIYMQFDKNCLSKNKNPNNLDQKKKINLKDLKSSHNYYLSLIFQSKKIIYFLFSYLFYYLIIFLN